MSTFTPSTKLSAESNSRDWAYELGCLPQTASIVFSKASLIAFLKTHGIEVSPNYGEISKLPKYASIGKMSDSIPSNVLAAPQQVAEKVAPAPFTKPREIPSAPIAPTKPAPVPSKPVETPRAEVKKQQEVQEVRTSDGELFRPTRRVREAIGGGSAQIGALFDGGGDEYKEAVKEAEKEQARRRGLLVEEQVAVAEAQKPLSTIENDKHSTPASENTEKTSAAFRPTRRVREPGGTGGESSISLG